MIQQTQFRIAGLEFTFSVDLSDDTPVALRITAEPHQELPDTHLLRLIVEAADGRRFSVQKLSIEWVVPAVDMHGFYAGPPSPEELGKLPYWWVRKRARANNG